MQTSKDDQNVITFGNTLVLKEVVIKVVSYWIGRMGGLFNGFLQAVRSHHNTSCAVCKMRMFLRKITSKHQSLTIHDPLRSKDPGHFWCFRL
jgi:hypothetical protein